MANIQKRNLDLRFKVLALFIVCTFMDNHSALFISDYNILLVLFMILSFATKPIRKFIVINYNTAIFYILLVNILVSTALNIDGLDKGTLLSYLVWFLFMAVAVNDSPKNKNVLMLMKAFVFGAVIISVMVIIFRQNFYPSIEMGLRYTIKFMDNVAIDPNYLSSYLFVGIAISLYFSLFSVKKIFYRITTVIILMGIILVGSRGGYVAIIILGIGTIIQLFEIGSKNKKIFVVIAIPIVLLLMAILLPLLLPQEVINRFMLSRLFDYSNSLRVSHWLVALKCFVHKPILGYGAMHTLDILRIYASHRGVAHNTFITFMLHLGLPGFLMILWTVLCIYRKLKIHKNTYWRFFLIGFCFINCMIENHLGITFWIPLLMLTYISNNLKILNELEFCGRSLDDKTKYYYSCI